jgi:hypothetical protein
MNKLLSALCATVLLFCSVAAWAAGSTCTVEKVSMSDTYQIYIYSWTSDDTVGSVLPAACTNCSSKVVQGKITAVEFRSGSSVPTTAYDVTLLDNDGRDILMGTGANIASAITDTATQFKNPFSSDGAYVALYGVELWPSITNAGNSKTGKIILHVTGK